MQSKLYPLVQLVFSFAVFLFPVFSADCAEFQIIFKSSEEPAFCGNVLLKNNTFKCSDRSSAYIYAAETVKSVRYNGEQIYPFAATKQVSPENIAPENCDEIFESISGPLLLQKDQYSYFILAKMLEQGICVNKNINKARDYYRLSGIYGQADYRRLVADSRVRIDEGVARTIQEDANRKRELMAQWAAKCQQECTFDDNVENKYRYSKKCYNDCMSYMPKE